VSGSAWLGLLAAIGVSVFFSMVHAYACVTHHGNQVVSGMAINILVAGLGPVVGLVWFGLGGQTPALADSARFRPIHLPLEETLENVPFLGSAYSEIISGHNLFVYFAFAAVPITAWILYRNRFGLRLRAVGENPEAVDTAGISVYAMRYQALIITGVLCGIAGAFLATAQNASFIRNMTAGQGFIALAALIFGKWRPVPTMLACLLFAFSDALQVRLQGVDIPGIGVIPVQFVQALPFVLTVIVLAGFIGSAIPPKAGGQPYIKER
jgi:simple sugar transport system permease protein